MKQLLVLSLILFTSVSLFAQEAAASIMTGSGKIYVVLATVLTIFVGIIVYLVSLDMKVSRIERQIED